MGRLYTTLPCGCVVSCDAGGGMASDCCTTTCDFPEWVKKHPLCRWCGYCLKCTGKDFHAECRNEIRKIKLRKKAKKVI